MKQLILILSYVGSFSAVIAQTGALDFTFDGDGRLTTGFQHPISVWGRASAVQNDGKTVVIGNEDLFDGDVCELARFNTNGSLDHTFGQGGKIRTLESDYFNPQAMAIQQDGKILTAGYNLNGAMVVRFNSNGTIDNSFSQDGKVATKVGTGTKAQSIAVQSDGKIIVAGFFSANSGTEDYDFLVMRYNSDGTLDNSFNGTGIITRLGSSWDEATAIALLPNGKIVVAGYIKNSNFDFVVTRYSSSGKLDKTFDGDGVVITDIAGDDISRSMAVQADGKIIVGGQSNNGVSNVLSLIRYNTDGSLDATFSGDGKHTESLEVTLGAESIIIDASGKIIVGAHSNKIGTILRFNTDATLDATFSGDGKVYTNIELGWTLFNYDAIVKSVVALQGAKIILTGTHYDVTVNNLAVLRYNSQGNIDKTYSSDGIALAEFNVGSIGSSVRSIAVQSDKKIVVAGSSGLARYNSNGTVDTAFNLNGQGTIYFGSYYLDPYAVAIQKDGKIVVAGRRYDFLTPSDFVVTRLNPNGSIDKTFNSSGTTVTDFSNSSEDLVENGCLALQADGKILVAGSTFNQANSSYDVAIVRYNTNGTLDNTFDGDGKVTTDIENRNQQGNAIAIQSDGKIIVAGDAVNSSNNNDIAVFRYNTNGSLDQTFNSTGIKTTDIAQHDDHGKSVQIQTDGKIVVGGFAFTNPNRDFTVVRYNTNGSHDITFSGNENVTTAIETNSNDYGTSLAIQADGKILLGGYYNSSNGGLNNFALVRYNSNGTIDNTFGGNGNKRLVDFGSVEDSVFSAALQPDGQLVMGGSSNGNFALARFLTAAPSFSATRLNKEDLSEPSIAFLNISPNPLSAKAVVSYTLDKDEFVTIQLFNASGQKMKDLVNGAKSKGVYQLQLTKGKLTPGIYFIKMSTTTQQISRKVIIQ